MLSFDYTKVEGRECYQALAAHSKDRSRLPFLRWLSPPSRSSRRARPRWCRCPARTERKKILTTLAYNPIYHLVAITFKELPTDNADQSVSFLRIHQCQWSSAVALSKCLLFPPDNWGKIEPNFPKFNGEPHLAGCRMFTLRTQRKLFIKCVSDIF